MDFSASFDTTNRAAAAVPYATAVLVKSGTQWRYDAVLSEYDDALRRARACGYKEACVVRRDGAVREVK